MAPVAPIRTALSWGEPPPLAMTVRSLAARSAKDKSSKCRGQGFKVQVVLVRIMNHLKVQLYCNKKKKTTESISVFL